MLTHYGDNMHKLDFIDSLPPATDAEILALEELIGVTLPEKMKGIYKKYNGGQPRPSFVHDEKNFYPINAFFSIPEIVEAYSDYIDGAFPEGFGQYDMLPFAYDPGSGIYSISLQRNSFGHVYFYVLHEKAEVFGWWSSFELFVSSIVDE